MCQDNPLAVCDYRTVSAETDLITCDRVIPERAGEVYYIHHNESQQWVKAMDSPPKATCHCNASLTFRQCFLKDQTVDELLVMLMYDEESGHHAKCGPERMGFPRQKR